MLMSQGGEINMQYTFKTKHIKLVNLLKALPHN